MGTAIAADKLMIPSQAFVCLSGESLDFYLEIELNPNCHLLVQCNSDERSQK